MGGIGLTDGCVLARRLSPQPGAQGMCQHLSPRLRRPAPTDTVPTTALPAWLRLPARTGGAVELHGACWGWGSSLRVPITRRCCRMVPACPLRSAAARSTPPCPECATCHGRSKSRSTHQAAACSTAATRGVCPQPHSITPQQGTLSWVVLGAGWLLSSSLSTAFASVAPSTARRRSAMVRATRSHPRARTVIPVPQPGLACSLCSGLPVVPVVALVTLLGDVWDG